MPKTKKTPLKSYLPVISAVFLFLGFFAFLFFLHSRTDPQAQFARQINQAPEIKNTYEQNKLSLVLPAKDQNSVEVKLGDANAKAFAPDLELSRWDGEVSLKLKPDVSAVPAGEKSLSFDNDKIKLTTPQAQYRFYRQPNVSAEGGYEFEIIYDQKPQSNIVSIPIETKNLDFFYQPPLNVEMASSTCTATDCGGKHRPENVVGSYAVYYQGKKSGDYTALGGKNYRSGKAFHIFRPQIIDSQGNKVWGELNVDTAQNKLAVTVPQDFLDKAVYPLTVDPTFGYGTIGQSDGLDNANELEGSPFTSPSDAAAVSSISVAFSPSYSGNWKGVIVLESSLNILANGVTDAGTMPTGEVDYKWATTTFAIAPTIAGNTSYVLMLTPDATIHWAYDSIGTHNDLYDSSNSFANPTNPTDGGWYDGYQMSVYATYTTLAGTLRDSVTSGSYASTFKYQPYIGAVWTSGASAYTLKGVQLPLKKVGSPTGTLSLHIYSDSSGRPGSNLGVSTNTVAISSLTTSNIDTNFDFSGVSISAGTKYWFVLSDFSTGTDNSNYVSMTTTVDITTNPYPMQNSSNGTSWTDYDQLDINYKTYGDAVAVAGTSCSYVCNGLVGYWPFNTNDISGVTAYDRSGSSPANNGTICGATTAGGKLGQGLSYNGTSDYVDAGKQSSLNGLSNLTYSAWIYSHAVPDAYQEIMSKYTKMFFLDKYDATHLFARFVVSASDITNLSASCNDILISPNTWTHVAVTWDGVMGAGTTGKFYVNGVQCATFYAAGAGTMDSDASNDFMIGVRNASEGFFGGFIDEARVYNRMLSASEIREIYQKDTVVNKTVVGKPQTNLLTSGLVGYWSFNGADMIGTTTALDRSGSSPANNGTNNGATPAIGVTGQALKFDSLDDYVDAGTLGDAAMTENGPLTISAWIYPKSLGQSSAGRIVNRDSVDFSLYSATNAFQFQVIGNTVLYRLSSDNLIIYNKWQHVVVTWDGSTNASNVHFYINGSPSDGYAHDGANPYDNSTAHTFVGNNSNLNRSFDGSIDEVRVYNRTLSASEITQLYQAGSANKTVVNSPSGAPGGLSGSNGLVGYWSFNGQDMGTTSARDLSGNNNTGWLNGGVKKIIGKVGQALSFNGTDSYVDAGHQSSLNDLSNLTYSAWIYLRSPAGTSNSIISKTERGFSLNNYLSPAALDFYISTDNQNLDGFCNSIPIQLNKWTQVAVTWNGVIGASEQTDFYINGVLCGNVIINNGLGAPESEAAYNLGIGASPYSSVTGLPAAFFPGLIDEVRVYNRALSASEIKALYAQDAGGLKTRN